MNKWWCGLLVTQVGWDPSGGGGVGGGGVVGAVLRTAQVQLSVVLTGPLSFIHLYHPPRVNGRMSGHLPAPGLLITL